MNSAGINVPTLARRFENHEALMIESRFIFFVASLLMPVIV